MARQLNPKQYKELVETGLVNITQADETVLMTKPGSNNPANVKVCDIAKCERRGFTMGHDPKARPPKDSSPPTAQKLLEDGKTTIEEAKRMVAAYDKEQAEKKKK